MVLVPTSIAAAITRRMLQSGERARHGPYRIARAATAPRGHVLHALAPGPPLGGACARRRPGCGASQACALAQALLATAGNLTRAGRGCGDRDGRRRRGKDQRGADHRGSALGRGGGGQAGIPGVMPAANRVSVAETGTAVGCGCGDGAKWWCCVVPIGVEVVHGCSHMANTSSPLGRNTCSSARAGRGGPAPPGVSERWIWGGGVVMWGDVGYGGAHATPVADRDPRVQSRQPLPVGDSGTATRALHRRGRRWLVDRRVSDHRSARRLGGPDRADVRRDERPRRRGP